MDKTCIADLADMNLKSKRNKLIHFLLSIIDVYHKYSLDIPLKYNKCETITRAFPKIVKESNHNTNKIWVDKGSGFYNRSMKPWLQDNKIIIYSRHKEQKPIVTDHSVKI